MFTCVGREGAPVNALDPGWDEVELQGRCRRGELVCGTCRQELVFRRESTKSTRRRRHFAHRTLSDCPASDESPQRLEAKASLYLWLRGKAAAKGAAWDVLMDQAVPPAPDLQGEDLRPVDLVVTRDGEPPLAYWIFDRQLRSEAERLGLDLSLRLAFGERITWVFTASVLRLTPTGRALTLSTTERSFMARTRYDVDGGASLHYVDAEQGLQTFRGLRLWHGANAYRAERSPCTAIDERLLIHPGSGEFVHPEDLEVEERWRAIQARRAAARESRLEARARRRQRVAEASGESVRPGKASGRSRERGPRRNQYETAPADADLPGSRRGVCSLCGIERPESEWTSWRGTPPVEIKCTPCMSPRGEAADVSRGSGDDDQG